MKRRPLPLAPALFALALLAPAPRLAAQHVPDRVPATERLAVVDTVAGHPVPDPYRWLEDRTTPDVRAWITAQNRYKDSVLTDLPALPRVEKRFMELFDIEEVRAPRFVDGELYYMKRPKGAQRFSLYVRHGLHGPERVLLDPASFSRDSTVTVHLVGVWGANK